MEIISEIKEDICLTSNMSRFYVANVLGNLTDSMFRTSEDMSAMTWRRSSQP